ncbi:sushi, von Willebrand factor type A, EGF and pentraxin domain-containing protein 1-like [Corticium candelabrum]|uniref:sushi, von Willebrand factor type A, EGF and pentraxin domain-containing protein 1-like n=1 Tax=Corticium candelabrum TaxID=121492 RepID=UPI002E27627E|nr:sushi, von Willebrand factor type A, EGF and pentraxin domain-containing protein 1-like [Corticium candelabrum]
MTHEENISYVKLHLRDGLKRRRQQNGLTVSVSNSSNIDSATRCSDRAYDASTHGQSPVFVCMNQARYIWVVLRNSPWHLQVCEVRAYTGPMNLNAPGIASLSDVPYTDHVNNVTASAANAVDGKSSIGQSRGLGLRFCAVNNYKTNDKVQFLRISLHQKQPILSVRLHLRDPARGFIPTVYYSRLGSVNISVGNSSDVSDVRRQCGSSYQASQGQSPIFICYATGSYVWLTVSANYFLEVCEVEVYADVHCITPSSLVNGKYSITNDSVGGSLSVECNQGYKSTFSKPITCESSGNWSQPFPTCKAFCEPPPNVKNGKLIFSDNDGKQIINSTVTYECDNGYKLSDETKKTRKCLSSKQWSGTAQSCHYIDCGRPRLTTNGNFTGNTTYNSTITFTCRNGYYMKGIRKAKCLSSGLWSNIPSNCIPFCEPPQLTNGYLEFSDNSGVHDVDSTVTYHCDQGYESSDDKQKTRRCQENRKWSGTAPTCTQIQCPDISNKIIEDGSILNNNRLLGSIAVYECNRGYRIAGDKTRVCQSNGKWSGNPPVCQGNKCVSLASPTNGNVTTEIVHTIVISTYTCESGYRLKNGDSSRICLPSGLWSGKEPSCEPCSCDSTQTRQDANKKRHAVVLVQVTSSVQENEGQVSFKAKVKKVCRANNARARKIKSGNFASLAVTQETQHGTCRCPDFQKKVMYRVGVKVNGKSGKKWQLEVPRKFYVAESTVC